MALVSLKMRAAAAVALLLPVSAALASAASAHVVPSAKFTCKSISAATLSSLTKWTVQQPTSTVAGSGTTCSYTYKRSGALGGVIILQVVTSYSKATFTSELATAKKEGETATAFPGLPGTAYEIKAGGLLAAFWVLRNSTFYQDDVLSTPAVDEAVMKKLLAVA